MSLRLFYSIADLSYGSYLLSECEKASPGSACTNLEANDCKFKIVGEECCCGQCSDPGWLNLACVPNTTTGAGLWQIDPPRCPADGCGSQGEQCRDKCQNIPFVEFNLKDCLPQVLSPRQTTLENIRTTLIKQREYKWRVAKS